VHGCFWHGCPKCVDGRRRVGTNAPYWSKKIAGNAERDQRQATELLHHGWRVLTIWECETVDPKRLAQLAQKIRTSKLLAKNSRPR
jgi:DNA mismatch endonuclease (patch repair protein)